LRCTPKDGDTYVKYRDDERQANDAQGDTAVKHAKIYKKNGQYHFGSDRNTIYFAVSESVVSAPLEVDGTSLRRRIGKMKGQSRARILHYRA
jgi:hypothetical protein